MWITDAVDSVRDAATVRRVFGEPVQQDGVTVIPATAVRTTYGGGSGRDPKGQDGEGGGAMLTARPVGVFVVGGDEVRWVPVVDVTRLVTVAGLVAGAYLIVQGRGRRAGSPARRR
jgi:uncharacterized spore protein YtfJ